MMIDQLNNLFPASKSETTYTDKWNITRPIFFPATYAYPKIHVMSGTLTRELIMHN